VSFNLRFKLNKKCFVAYKQSALDRYLYLFIHFRITVAPLQVLKKRFQTTETVPTSNINYTRSIYGAHGNNKYGKLMNVQNSN